MNSDIATFNEPSEKNHINQFYNNELLTKFADPSSSHPLQIWIENNPGATRLQVAESSYDLSRYQVYNWLASAVERGEVLCIEGMYYPQTHGQ